MKSFAVGLLLFTRAASAMAAGIESSAAAQCRTSDPKKFERAALRLRDVDHWPIPGFTLRDSAGEEVERLAQVDDLIEIHLPADPSNRSYWVRIESEGYDLQAQEDSNFYTLIVRPTVNPQLPERESKTVDHFFTDQATNTFSVSFDAGVLQARVHGVNEIANRKFVRSPQDSLFNLTIANAAWGIRDKGKEQSGLGPQKLTWDHLTRSLANCD